MNGNVPVTFIAHSLGGRMLLYFLQQMSQSWKDMHVKRVLAFSVPWGGSTRTVQALSVGYDFGIWFLSRQKMLELERTYTSVVWLLPSEYFWKSHDVIAVLNGKMYTIKNIKQFFK